MKLDENEFFRQATLRICSSLEIEKALFNCLQYIRLIMPASMITLNLFDPGTGVLRHLATVDLVGSDKPFLPPIQLSREAIKEIEADKGSLDPQFVNQWTKPSLVKILLPYIDLSNYSSLVMQLEIEDKRQVSFAVVAEGKERFTKAHAHLVSLLREPLSIAVSNALRYEEVVKLKDILNAENRELSRGRGRFPGEIIGAEYGLKPAMGMVREVAPLNSPVILLGETGVGKEVVANAIHYTSSRRGGPFIKVNCGAIPDNLLDSELFGHERGAFTGAVAQKRGRFERADKGTIFLDEIAELPLQAQVRLLRVLQHREIERVGGTKTIPVDVRIIAATHRDMEKLILTGEFREDLWFRLNVFPIMIPPLRHRKEDIPALVHHFIEMKSKDLQIYPPPSVSAEEVERLKAYHWPGNVRELENLIERELIHLRGKGKSGLMTFQHLEMPRRAEGAGILNEIGDSFLPLDEAVSRYILQALKITNGKISGPRGAAELLGINPHTLRSRMRKLGISLKYS